MFGAESGENRQFGAFTTPKKVHIFSEGNTGEARGVIKNIGKVGGSFVMWGSLDTGDSQ